MKVSDVMTTAVVTVGSETPLRDVAVLLTERRISGLPVVDDGRVVGVVSEGDILAKERGMSPSDTTPTTRPSSTTGAPEILRRASKAATSRSGVSLPTVRTSVVMTSKTFMGSRSFPAARLRRRSTPRRILRDRASTAHRLGCRCPAP